MPWAPERPCREPGCPHLQPCPTHGGGALARQRRDREAGRRLYDTQRWRRARRAFLADHPMCVDCSSEGRYALAAHVDHIDPHRGDEAKFWDVANWQALCAMHHSRKTKKEVLG